MNMRYTHSNDEAKCSAIGKLPTSNKVVTIAGLEKTSRR